MSDKNLNLYILGYGSCKTLDNWFDPKNFPNTNVYIIDNGRQQYSDKLKPFVIHTTKHNIGCAGGWNLICSIGFQSHHFDRIIISNEDNIFTENMLYELDWKTNDLNIAGTYDRAFEFSLFSLTKELYYNVGKFDENFIMASSEDLDYKYRCKLKNISVSCLGYSADMNKSETGGDTIPVFQRYNKWYFEYKWGQGTFLSPFNIWENPYNANDNFWSLPMKNHFANQYNPTIGNAKWPSQQEFMEFIIKTEDAHLLQDKQ